MFPNPDAVRLMADFLVEHGIPYMVIGGLANSVWGEPRATLDADFKVSLSGQSLSDFRALIVKRFPERQTNIPPHLQSAHVVHIWAMPGVAVDLLISVFDYERQAIERAVPTAIGGVLVRVCTAEDFIVHKVVANRDHDWVDVERVLMRQKSKLDQAYIMDWLKQFSEGLEAPEILTRYQELRAHYDPT
ncbi:MAG: nucleotidyltransferase [Chloroflexi bacterium]|nr:nucleotidyltransferase [Chloroflexota bacterium]